MSENRDDIDWSATTWEGSRRAQLRHALTLTLRERLEAMEGLAEVAQRFAEMRARSKLNPAPAGPAPTQVAPGARKPSPPSDADEKT